MGYIEQSGGERREHSRLKQPQLYVRVGGRIYRTLEWSYGGLLIEDESGFLPTGALIRIDGLADEQAYQRAASPLPVDIRARVIRAMRDEGVAALSCLKLDDAAYRILRTIGGDFTEAQTEAQADLA